MIEAVETSLPEGRQIDIAQWLNRSEADEFLGSLKAEVAALISKATRLSLEEPHRLLGYPQIIGPQSEELFRRAALLQICIDVINDKRSLQNTMISVTLKIL